MRAHTAGRARPYTRAPIDTGPGGSAPVVITGRVLAGRYELLRHVASGGMASVWEATDQVLGRSVAIKVLHPHLAEDATFLERFRAEGRSAARLSHAAVVAIYDTVSEPGCEAIVMELVAGQTLRSFLDTNGPLPFADAIAVADQVAGALEAAHDAGIVHRDVKPANILLCADRRVKVTDFGIAKAASATDETTDETTDGVLLGTAKYLAPEQVAGHAVDARADIYSLGVVLYETLTGTVPFEGDTPAATALARLERDPPPVATRRAGVPPGLAAVVGAALARDPAERYASAAALRASLAAALIPPPPVDPTTVLADLDAAASPVAPSSVAAPAATAPPGATTPRRSQEPVVLGDHDTLRAVVVGFVVVGTLVLGIALFAATTIGRDLYQRVQSTVSDTIVNDDASTAAPPPGPATGDQPPAPVTDAGGEAPADAVTIASVTDFDPEGDGTEHGDRAPLVADGAPGTFWHTERYDTRQFGNLKSGVGLVVALDGTRPLNRLEIESATRGWAGRVFVSDGAAADLGGWGQPVDGRVDVDGTVRFDLRGVVGSHLLVWFTDLGNEVPRPRLEVSELTVS